jgi:hypothetical protein
MSFREQKVETVKTDEVVIDVAVVSVSKTTLSPVEKLFNESDPQKAGLNKVFRTNQPLTTDEISSLLGISDMHRKDRIEVNPTPQRHKLSLFQIVGLSVFSLMVAALLFLVLISPGEPEILQAGSALVHPQ